MKRNIKLYIGGQEVDLSNDSIIQFTYTMDDLTDPAVVKNSYSQTVTLPATPNNDKVFGHIAEMTRVTAEGTFNPLVRTPFAIYRNGELLEEGYAKLEAVKVKGGNRTYEVMLFGGLGSFFYSLSYDEEGNKKSLASLSYLDGEQLDFRIYKETVEEAWANLGGRYTPRSRWQTLNFAPAFNGLPDGDFSADKAMCNPANANYPTTITDSQGRTLTATNFISLSKDYTEWEVKDLRSYLQRPVIRMRAMLEAMCDETQNGGFKVSLDSSFFKASNPMWQHLWMALPILNTLEIPEDGGEVKATWSQSIVPLTSTFEVNYGSSLEGATINEVSLAMTFNPVGRFPEGTYRLRYNNSDISAVATITAYDKSGAVVKSGSVSVSAFTSDGLPNGTFSDEVVGVLTNFVNMASLTIEVAIPEGAVLRNTSTNTTYPFVALRLLDRSGASYVNYSGATAGRSGVLIKQEILLATEHTPADYLLSYAKMCGLHFLYDKNSKTISIVSRNTLYGSAKHIDLTERIDRGADIKIKPYAIEDKWYDFKQPIEGEYADYYKEIYGKDYGEQIVNTGFEFNAEHNDVMKSVVFGGVAEVRERSKYFNRISQPVDGVARQIPSVFLDAGNRVLYKLAQLEQEADVPTARSYATIAYLDETYKSYFNLALPQFHGEDNSANDAGNALLFFSGLGEAYVTLTDDTAEMMRYNENEPCWILNEQSEASIIPLFSRYDGSFALDWGIPQEVDNPTFDVAADWMTLYRRFWRDYMQDRFTLDAKVVTARVDLSQLQVGEALLRNFYYFDGAVWALNKISNYSVTSYTLTECEFIKIGDISNYTNGQKI